MNRILQLNKLATYMTQDANPSVPNKFSLRKMRENSVLLRVGGVGMTNEMFAKLCCCTKENSRWKISRETVRRVFVSQQLFPGAWLPLIDVIMKERRENIASIGSWVCDRKGKIRVSETLKKYIFKLKAVKVKSVSNRQPIPTLFK